jgi:hypothetical protein
MIDTDLTIPPEALPKSYGYRNQEGQIRQRHRLIYPMEHEACARSILFANRCFAYLFSYLSIPG